MNIDPTIQSILGPIFEEPRSMRLIPNLPFTDYQALPGTNASLLKEKTTLEMLHYAIGNASLPSFERALIELTGGSACDVADRLREYEPRKVPARLIHLAKLPAPGDKISAAQEAVLDKLRGGSADSREFNASTLAALERGGWIQSEDTEKEEVQISSSAQESRAMQFAIGDATHKAILEPDLFDDGQWQKMYQLSPTSSITSRAALAALAEDPTRELVTPEIIDTARRCRDAVHGHKEAAQLLSQRGDSEITLEGWDNEALCNRKCRFDRLPADPEYGIIDIKTTRGGLTKGELQGAVYKNGYHAQAAYYLDLLAKHEGQRRGKFLVIWVTKKKPFMCRVTDLMQEPPETNFVEQGRDLIAERLAMWVVAWHEQRWEAYENEGAVSLAARPSKFQS